MAKVVVLDANGLGVGLADELLKDTIDNSTGKDLGCWDTINDDNVPEVPNSPQILYNMKAQTWQNEIVSTFIDMVDSGKLRLLEKDKIMILPIMNGIVLTIKLDLLLRQMLLLKKLRI